MTSSLTSEADPRALPFHYTPPDRQRPKVVTRLARTPTTKVAVQVVGPDGANNLHAHRHQEGVWFVLAGRARFHGPDGVLAELDPHSGIVIPRGVSYWFESVSDDDLQILQVESSNRPSAQSEDDRIDVEQPPPWLTGDLLAPPEATASPPTQSGVPGTHEEIDP